MEFICKMDKVSVLENKAIYSFKLYSEQEELDSFIIDTYNDFKILHDKEIERLKELKLQGYKLISSMGI